MGETAQRTCLLQGLVVGMARRTRAVEGGRLTRAEGGMARTQTAPAAEGSEERAGTNRRRAAVDGLCRTTVEGGNEMEVGKPRTKEVAECVRCTKVEGGKPRTKVAVGKPRTTEVVECMRRTKAEEGKPRTKVAVGKPRTTEVVECMRRTKAEEGKPRTKVAVGKPRTTEVVECLRRTKAEEGKPRTKVAVGTSRMVGTLVARAVRA